MHYVSEKRHALFIFVIT